VEICKQVTILIIYEVSSKAVTPLKFIYSTIHVSTVLVLTVRCRLINFFCQIFPLFIPEMPAGSTSYIVQFLLSNLLLRAMA
jgi:uncharacterized membrane protein YesL